MDDGEIEVDDIGADFREALSSLREEAPPDPTPPPEAAPEQPEAESGPARDEQGRFASKPKTESPPVPKTEGQAEPEAKPASAEAAPVSPPRSWKPEAKAAFLALPPEVQKQVIESQAEIDKQAQDFTPKAQRLEQLEALIAPHKERWALNGVSETQAIQQLLAASDYLERDPVNAIHYLMRSTGVTLQHLTGQGGQQPAQQQPQGAHPLERQVQQITQYLTQQQQEANRQKEAEKHEQESAVQSEIDAFASDPKNVYFDNVKEDMAILIRAGRAKDLSEAYDMAIWARPDIRKLVTAAERAEEAKRQAAENQKRVAQARSAGGSVIGSPGLGKPAPRASSPNIVDDIRGDVVDALKAVRENS